MPTTPKFHFYTKFGGLLIAQFVSCLKVITKKRTATLCSLITIVIIMIILLIHKSMSCFNFFEIEELFFLFVCEYYNHIMFPQELLMYIFFLVIDFSTCLSISLFFEMDRVNYFSFTIGESFFPLLCNGWIVNYYYFASTSSPLLQVNRLLLFLSLQPLPPLKRASTQFFFSSGPIFLWNMWTFPFFSSNLPNLLKG